MTGQQARSGIAAVMVYNAVVIVVAVSAIPRVLAFVKEKTRYE